LRGLGLMGGDVADPDSVVCILARVKCGPL
jgi:hypothetical protein